jgi:hypothetical protein
MWFISPGRPNTARPGKFLKHTILGRILGSTVDIIQRLHASDGSSISEQYFFYVPLSLPSLVSGGTMSPKTPSGAAHDSAVFITKIMNRQLIFTTQKSEWTSL